MNSFKRILALVLALMLMLSLCACGGSGDSTSEPSQSVGSTGGSTESTPESTPEASSGPAYTVKVVDEGGNPIAGAMVQICLDVCIPGVTDADGVASWNVEEADYKVSFLSLPEGYTYSGEEQEFYFDGSMEMTITLKAVA